MDNWKFNADDNIILAKVGMSILNVLEKCSSPIVFIVKKCDGMEDMST